MMTPELLGQIDKDLYHRGPDAGGNIVEDGWALVFRRLSILDPRHEADQPMKDPDGRYTLVFNGEIYNFQGLRDQLQAEGVVFRTNGDTEVLLQGFIRWGERVVEKLEGMFAFVIVDHRAKRITAARDPFGIKPLYLRKIGQTIGLASEMRPLLRLAAGEPDPVAVSELLTFGWAAGSLSNVKGIDRVLPGTILSFKTDGSEFKQRRYKDMLDTLQPGEALSEADALELISSALEKSLKDHLVSDVGYTLQLSGGVDSSLLTVLARKETDGALHSFGIDLGDYELNEKEWRDKVVTDERLIHHEVPMRAAEFADALPRAVHHMEGPVPHGGCVMLMRLCDEIKKTSKVVLTGEGADELFGGYERYALWMQTAKKEQIAKWIPPQLMPPVWPFLGIKKMGREDAAVWASVYSNTARLKTLFPGMIGGSEARQTASDRFSDFRDRLRAVDQVAYLESLLVRQDKMAMAASVESRVPFVHEPFSRTVSQLSLDLLIPGGVTKPLLKKVAEKYLPRDLLYRRKVGLVLPYDQWCRDSETLGRYLDLLVQPDSQLANYADRQALRGVIDAFRRGAPEEKGYMFRLINIEMWLRDLADTKPVAQDAA